jgi:hypothetical protein
VVSIANFDLVCRERKKSLQMIETAYCYRHLNFFELTVISEKNYPTNIEEVQVNLGLRPEIKITVSYLPYELITKFLDEALS